MFTRASTSLLSAACLSLLGGCGLPNFSDLRFDGDSDSTVVVPTTWAGSPGAGAWQHPLGAVLDVPPGWETIPTDGSSAFLPPEGRAADGSFRVVTAFVYLPAPGIESVMQRELLEAADREMAFLAESVVRTADPERIALSDREGLHLGYDTQDPRGQGRIELYLTLHEGLAVALLSSGEREPVARHSSSVLAMFQSLRFTRPTLDLQLAGRWSHSESYTSGTFSMATETVLLLDASGQYSMTSEAAGGDYGGSFDTGEGDADTGFWSASDGALVLRANDGSTRVYRYRIVDGTLVLDDEAGNRRYFN